MVLTHDFMHGQMGAWLPGIGFGFRLLGPPLLLISSLTLVIELMRALWPPKPRTETGPPLTPRFVVWFVRLLGLFLLAVPFLTILSINLNRPPGVRPGNEGEGLGITAVFFLFFPMGAALTWLSFRFKTRESVAREQGENGANR